MATTLAGSALERMLDSVAECFTPETSRRLAELPAALGNSEKDPRPEL
jgi:hypothetical protein